MMPPILLRGQTKKKSEHDKGDRSLFFGRENEDP
jgi:hypothetical protein